MGKRKAAAFPDTHTQTKTDTVFLFSHQNETKPKRALVGRPNNQAASFDPFVFNQQPAQQQQPLRQPSPPQQQPQPPPRPRPRAQPSLPQQQQQQQQQTFFQQQQKQTFQAPPPARPQAPPPQATAPPAPKRPPPVLLQPLPAAVATASDYQDALPEEEFEEYQDFTDGNQDDRRTRTRAT